MADIQLFSVKGQISELAPKSVALEKELQMLIESNMSQLFGVTFLQSEFSISNGRIDSLGIDENYCPVIFEYKRTVNENVINQGLFYLDWLLDHKADFQLLVINKLGMEEAQKIDWRVPCVMCIASDFTKYDEHAVNQMQRNIKLIRYKMFDANFLLFEHLNAPIVKPIVTIEESGEKKKIIDKTFKYQYENVPEKMRLIFDDIRDYILSGKDDVTENELKFYLAFRKVKNFICGEIYNTKIFLNMNINPDEVELQDDFIKDIRNIGHWGTGQLQVIIKDKEDFEAAKGLIDRAYEEN